ncbi:hypothetical protein [Yimella sp. cx-51]|uniref:hypothetical protein n=2 Tax=Yimella sp. cx-51 TaxID=2770551 RepID=UPI00165E7B01|nr:hypothetical protein [Yimella sp. cx-51]MBC9956371.1 hypothetical protein [Yimella sp. cx-51]
MFVMLAAAKEPVPYFDAVHMTLTQADPFPVDEAQDASTRPAREPANSRLLIVAGAVLYIVAIVLAPRFLPLPVIVLVSLFSAGLMASGLARSRVERDRRRAEK